MIISATPRGLTLTVSLSEEEVADIVRDYNAQLSTRGGAALPAWNACLITYGAALIRVVIDRVVEGGVDASIQAFQTGPRRGS